MHESSGCPVNITCNCRFLLSSEHITDFVARVLAWESPHELMILDRIDSTSSMTLVFIPLDSIVYYNSTPYCSWRFSLLSVHCRAAGWWCCCRVNQALSLSLSHHQDFNSVDPIFLSSSSFVYISFNKFIHTWSSWLPPSFMVFFFFFFQWIQ